MKLWTAPAASGRLEATVVVPGSKSITNRAYLLAALATEPVRIRHPLESRDTELMLDALAALGAQYTPVPDGVRLAPMRRFDDAPADVRLGNAGTVARFTPALAALGHRPVRFDGDEAIRRRPLAPLLTALSELGAEIDDAGRGTAPFTVHGHGRVAGGEVWLDASASSQFLSALLLAAPAFANGATVRLTAEPPSEPHIAMTMDLLDQFGASPRREGSTFHVPPGPLRRAEYVVEPDLSTAAPFVLAPAVAGGTVHIAGWPHHTTQPGGWLRTLLTELGTEVRLDATGLTITGTGALPGAQLNLAEVGELTPVVAAALCFADGPSVITGVAHLRGHETDRLAALANELSGLGADVTQTEDGLRITPSRLHAGVFHTYDDHRLVMAAAVLGLRVPGIRVPNAATVGKTYPGFVEAWQDMLDQRSTP